MAETKTKQMATCRAMLARYRNGDTMNEQDSQFLLNLLQRHPEAPDKIGCGVRRFFKARATSKGTNCFWLEREDGKARPWNKSLPKRAGKPSSPNLTQPRKRTSSSTVMLTEKSRAK